MITEPQSYYSTMATKLAVRESTKTGEAAYSYQSEDRGNIGSRRRKRTSRQVYRTRTRGYTGDDLDSEDTAGCGRTESKVK